MQVSILSVSLTFAIFFLKNMPLQEKTNSSPNTIQEYFPDQSLLSHSWSENF